MGGSIFVIDSGSVTELKESRYDSEAIFQELIEKFPNILAGDQITPDDPRRWIFVSREIGVPSQLGGSDQWFLDHLFIDHEGIPTFVEVKRSTDTRIRREVVAQMLDYAANATEYWPVESIRDLYENQNRNLTDDFGFDETEIESYWSKVHENLRAGKIRLLFVADEIPMSLRRIIEFLNGQMTETEVLGLEIKQFVSDREIKTLVPKIIGQTINSSSVKNRGQVKWDEESFLLAVGKLSGEVAVRVCSDVIRGFESLGCRIWWGRGKKHASMIAVFDGKQSYPLVSLYPFTRNTVVELQFQHLKEPYDSMEKRKELQDKWHRIEGVIISDDRLEKRPSFDWQVLQKPANMEKFFDIFREMISVIRRYEGSAN